MAILCNLFSILFEIIAGAPLQLCMLDLHAFLYALFTTFIIVFLVVKFTILYTKMQADHGLEDLVRKRSVPHRSAP